MSITPRQQEFYEYIIAYQKAHRCSPSIRDMSQDFGIQKNAVAKTLNGLKKHGLITYYKKRLCII